MILFYIFPLLSITIYMVSKKRTKVQKILTIYQKILTIFFKVIYS